MNADAVSILVLKTNYNAIIGPLKVFPLSSIYNSNHRSGIIRAVIVVLQISLINRNTSLLFAVAGHGWKI